MRGTPKAVVSNEKLAKLRKDSKRPIQRGDYAFCPQDEGVYHVTAVSTTEHRYPLWGAKWMYVLVRLCNDSLTDVQWRQTWIVDRVE